MNNLKKSSFWNLMGIIVSAVMIITGICICCIGIPGYIYGVDYFMMLIARVLRDALGSLIIFAGLFALIHYGREQYEVKGYTGQEDKKEEIPEDAKPDLPAKPVQETADEAKEEPANPEVTEALEPEETEAVEELEEKPDAADIDQELPEELPASEEEVIAEETVEEALPDIPENKDE